MASLGRASAILGAGTLISRVTGLVRTVVLVAALGSVNAGAADAFTIANQLPNNIYAIISTGLLTGVILPQIVKAAAHRDGGSAFVSKLLTLGTVALLGITAIAVVAAPAIVWLYGSQLPPATFALTVAFAYWCLPQVFFYGLYALLGEVLNARRVFGPYTWAPIINNVVSIVGFGVFIALFGQRTSEIGWTTEMIAVMGGTATLGIVAQAGILMLFWRQAKLTVRLDFRWRGMGLRHMARLAGWTFLMVVVGQIAGAIQTTVVGEASGQGASAATMAYAWFVFILPYSVIAYSIGTPYFTQLSEHAAAGRHEAVRSDLDTSVRIINVFMVGALAAVVAAAVPISRILSDSPGEAVQFAWVLVAYLVGLVPLAVLFVVQRTFYAYHDTFRPFLFTLVQAAIVITTTLAMWMLVAQDVLPVESLAAGIALGQSVAAIAQLAVAFVLLRRKLGPLGMGRAAGSTVRFIAAAIPAGAIGWLTFLLFGGVDGWTTDDRMLAVLGSLAVGAVALVVYVGFLALLRAPELDVARRAVRRFLPRR